jgi:hypothetical protein
LWALGVLPLIPAVSLSIFSAMSSSFLEAPGFEELADEGEQWAIASTEVPEVTTTGTARVAFLSPSPVMRALVDFFQVFIDANLGILVGATREIPAGIEESPDEA